MSEQAASRALRFASIAEDVSEVGQRDACLIEPHRGAFAAVAQVPPDTSVNELRAVCPGLVFADDPRDAATAELGPVLVEEHRVVLLADILVMQARRRRAD